MKKRNLIVILIVLLLVVSLVASATVVFNRLCNTESFQHDVPDREAGHSVGQRQANPSSRLVSRFEN